ncbi:MAG: CapA family protein [Bacteroidetes bacterium]|nr:MAG: CapA family protein [Bacteroidota bacterium]
MHSLNRKKLAYTAFCLLLLLASVFLFRTGNASSEAASPVNRPIAPKPDSLVSITLSAVGDLMCHMPQVNNSLVSENVYDFDPSFSEIKNYLSAADLTIGNLETTCAGREKGYSGYPQFNSPDEYVTAIKNAGFDFLVTSNNHSMDTEEKGLLRTLEVVRKNNLRSTGTFLSQADRDSFRILDMKGIKTGFLNYTYGTNGLLPSEDHKYMLNVIDTVLLQKDITSIRKKGAEIVIVLFHFGSEYISDPTDAQKLAARKSIQYGADIILGAHTHVIGPVEFFKTTASKLDSGLVAWSLGNFISNQGKRYSDAGVIFNIQLTKNIHTGAVRISSADFIPTWVYRGTNPLKKSHIVFPAEKCRLDTVASFIDSTSKQKMKEAFEDTKAVMTKYSSKVQLKSIMTEK